MRYSVSAKQRREDVSWALPDPHLPEPNVRGVHDEPPPFLGTWQRVYIGVVCYLAAIITLFWIFSKAFTS